MSSIDLDRFIDVAEDDPVWWNIWSKIGDTGPDDRGLKDGELTQAYPVEPGIDRDGVPYGAIGRKDLSGYVIFQILATKDVIREYFKLPAKNSNAYKRNRKTNYYLDIGNLFSAETVSDYRDHSKQIGPLTGLNDLHISDYRNNPARLNKEFVQGSVISGSYDIPGDYADLKTAVDDIGAIAGNTLEFVIVGANSPGADIDFDKVTDLGGMLWIHSTQYGFRDNPKVTGGAKWWRFDGSCNITMEDMWVTDISLHYDNPTTGSTGRTHIFRRMVFDKGINLDPFFPDIDKSGTPITIKFYGNLILGLVAATHTRGNNIIVDSSWGTVDWNDHIFFENNTLICDSTYTDGAILVSGSNNGYVFNNNAIYQSTGTISWKEVLTGGCGLNNCAYNKSVSGTFTQTACLTDLLAADFESVTASEDDCGRITLESRLSNTGWASGNIPEFTRDAVGGHIPTDGTTCIGAFFGGSPRDPVDSLALVDTAAQHTTLETELSEHITGMAVYSGDIYSKTYFEDEFTHVNGNKINVQKIVTRLEVDGVRYTKVYSTGAIIDTTYFHDLANGILYLQIASGETPNTHTIVTYFPVYFSEDGMILQVEIVMTEHNDLDGRQGGSATESFHFTETIHDSLQPDGTSTFAGTKVVDPAATHTIDASEATTNPATLDMLADRTSATAVSGRVRVYNDGVTPIAEIRFLRGSSDLAGDVQLLLANVLVLHVDENGSMGIGTSTFGTSAAKVISIANGTDPATRPANISQIGAIDSSDAKSTLSINTEQDIEAVGTFTATHKHKIWLNGVEYWIQLDAV